MPAVEGLQLSLEDGEKLQKKLKAQLPSMTRSTGKAAIAVYE
jgi:hypothetical protein